MKRIAYLALSALLTAFVLVLIGGVAGAYAAQTPVEVAVVESVPPTELPMLPPPAEPSAPTLEQPTPEPDYPVSAQTAVLVALAVAPNATLQGEPVLVMFEDRVAYEILTDQGLIYIDANDGTVLFNGTVPISIVITDPAPTQPSGGGTFVDRDDDHDDEREDDD